jgi:hypothetical protein
MKAAKATVVLIEKGNSVPTLLYTSEYNGS